jgi:hypothetical protein
LIALAVLLAAAGGAVAWAGSPAGPAIPWQVLGGGGAPAASTSGQVALVGSLGQTAIGPSLVGDDALGAGFWYGVGVGGPESRIYLPVVLRNV